MYFCPDWKQLVLNTYTTIHTWVPMYCVLVCTFFTFYVHKNYRVCDTKYTDILILTDFFFFFWEVNDLSKVFFLSRVSRSIMTNRSGLYQTVQFGVCWYSIPIIHPPPNWQISQINRIRRRSAAWSGKIVCKENLNFIYCLKKRKPWIYFL